MKTTVLAVLCAILTIGCGAQPGVDELQNESGALAPTSAGPQAVLNAQQTPGNTDGCIVMMSGGKLVCSQIHQKGNSIGIGTTDIPEGDTLYVAGTVHAYSESGAGLKGESGTSDGVVGMGGRYGGNFWSEGQCGAMLTSNIGWGACIEGDGGAKVTGYNGPAVSATSVQVSQPPNIAPTLQWVECPDDGEYGCPDGQSIVKVSISGGKVSRILCKSL
jgi:hypothetical protein